MSQDFFGMRSAVLAALFIATFISCASEHDRKKGDALGIPPSATANDPRLQQLEIYGDGLDFGSKKNDQDGNVVMETCQIQMKNGPSSPCHNVRLILDSLAGETLGETVAESGLFRIKLSKMEPFRLRLKSTALILEENQRVYSPSSKHPEIRVVLIKK